MIRSASMPNLPPIGELTRHSHISDWWESEPISIPFFSGLQLPFAITLGTTNGGYPPEVSEAIRNFLSLDEKDRLAATDRVFENYRAFAAFIAEANIDLKKPLVQIKDLANVWNYVTPSEIYVKRDYRVEGDECIEDDIYIVAACECAWEIEHGLQLVFHRGSVLTRVSEQDESLTD